MSIPFEYGRVVCGADFINRKEELKRLTTNFKSGVNTMIISPRRWGKSSLVREAGSALRKRKDLVVCHIDLYAVRTEQDFLKLFARELIKQTSSKWQDWAEAALAFIRNVIPKVAFGGPDMQAELELSWGSEQIDPLVIYQLPEQIAKKKKIRVVVCLDEFQNIAHFDDPLAVQKQMRSVWQLHQSASYCLYGSKKHWLTEIFSDYSMPFYRFGDLMYLEKIPAHHWEKFIVNEFSRTGKKITKEQVQQLTATVQLHPQYVQYLAQKIWIHTNTEVTEENFARGVDGLLKDTGIAFQRDVELLTATQLDFLKAYLDGVREFSSVETLSRYSLGGASNIVRIKKALQQKDTMDFSEAEPVFVDPMFELWLKKVYFKMI